jgi:uncharacterized glyoxalase superfamily protein PhnB
MPDVVPMVSYEDCAAASDWLVRAFGFEETDRIEWDGKVGHITLRAGDGTIFLGTPGERYVNPVHMRERSRDSAQMYDVPWTIDGVWVLVDDVESHIEQARAAGAKILSELEQGPVGLQYRAEDPEGHRWQFAQR